RARDRAGETRRHAHGVLGGRPRGPRMAARSVRPGRAVQPGEGLAARWIALRRPRRPAPGGMGVSLVMEAFAAEVGTSGPVRVAGGRTQWDVGGAAPPDVREVRAPVGV